MCLCFSASIGCWQGTTPLRESHVLVSSRGDRPLPTPPDPSRPSTLPTFPHISNLPLITWLGIAGAHVFNFPGLSAASSGRLAELKSRPVYLFPRVLVWLSSKGMFKGDRRVRKA